MIFYCIRDAWTKPNYQGNLLSRHSSVEVRFFCCLFGISLMSGGGAKRQSLSSLSSSYVGGSWDQVDQRSCVGEVERFSPFYVLADFCLSLHLSVSWSAEALRAFNWRVVRAISKYFFQHFLCFSERFYLLFSRVFCLALSFLFLWFEIFWSNNGLRAYESGSNFKRQKLVAAEVSVDVILEFSLSHLSLYFG